MGVDESPAGQFSRYPAFLAGLALTLGGGLAATFGIPLVRSASVIFIALCLVFQVLFIRRLRRMPCVLWGFLTFAAITAAAAAFSLVPSLATYKASMVGLYWGLFAVGFYNLFPRRRDVAAFLTGMLVGGVLYALLLALEVGGFPSASMIGRFYRLSLGGHNPILTGRIMAVSGPSASS